MEQPIASRNVPVVGQIECQTQRFHHHTGSTHSLYGSENALDRDDPDPTILFSL